MDISYKNSLKLLLKIVFVVFRNGIFERNFDNKSVSELKFLEIKNLIIEFMEKKSYDETENTI